MKTILAATDYSKPSVNALHYAIMLAKQTKSRLLLLHVFQVPVIPSQGAIAVIPFSEFEKMHNNKLKKIALTLQKKYGNTIEITYLAKAGFVFDVVEELIKNKKADLVVMGIKGAGKVSEIFIGSTASDVAGNIKCPVLIVPEKFSFEKPKKMVFASDNEMPADPSNLIILKELASVFKSKLLLLNVRNQNKLISSEKKKIFHIERYLSGISCSDHFVNNEYDDVVTAINAFLEENKTDMLIMIARKHSLLSRLFNERKTKKMAFHTRVPLLVLSDK